jgi:hypothetical protein
MAWCLIKHRNDFTFWLSHFSKYEYTSTILQSENVCKWFSSSLEKAKSVCILVKKSRFIRPRKRTDSSLKVCVPVFSDNIPSSFTGHVRERSFVPSEVYYVLARVNLLIVCINHRNLIAIATDAQPTTSNNTHYNNKSSSNTCNDWLFISQEHYKEEKCCKSRISLYM